MCDLESCFLRLYLWLYKAYTMGLTPGQENTCNIYVRKAGQCFISVCADTDDCNKILVLGLLWLSFSSYRRKEGIQWTQGLRLHQCPFHSLYALFLAFSLNLSNLNHNKPILPLSLRVIGIQHPYMTSPYGLACANITALRGSAANVGLLAFHSAS